jgi:hypothetical protein
MTRRMKSRWIVAGLCTLTAMVAGVNEAEAGSAAITITGGYKPGGGDPPYIYIFDATLNAPDPGTPGTFTFEKNNSFTVEGLPGVTSLSAHTQPPDWAVSNSNFVLLQAPPGWPTPYFKEDYTWTYKGSDVFNAFTPQGGPVGQAVPLGEFSVTSVYDFPVGGMPFANGTTLTFIYTYEFTPAGGTPIAESGTGTFQIFSVPEPSSLALLTVGSAVLPVGAWLRKRSRRAAERSGS